ncbi:UDP-2,3-diacylglucosamine diphosphatase [Carboxylicivirga mesophila]|uniref:UDP-2,3-diacylglucosamine diphosphatase n=1 Tax=Carboxylicivirga mesophila TaxID=1166478 RepID=A0ABS5K4W0_9BACT|nr:UDP-2,3-diacylglucosamine diphosphatase [Carboxylicivirga mesophila]MBS2210045.1 UDP-2,3-diacylglucosamine diphosphatase [Carboxylicivirga mesophila]
METNKKIYFASDVHLGAPGINNHRLHEKRFVNWLDTVKKDASEIYLMGDIFDFWFEYKHVVPRGFTRFLGKLSEITDSGIPVHFFTGNHDIWLFDYLENECGVKVYREPVIRDFNGKKVFLAHGDGLGHYDKHYNFLKSVFTNKFAQWLFARIHPNSGIGLANYWSGKSREKNNKEYGDKYLGDDNEFSVLYAKEFLKEEKVDYFVFGHRHVARTVSVGPGCQLIFLGDWIQHFSYGVFDGNTIELQYFDSHV